MTFTIAKDISIDKVTGYTYQTAPIVLGKKRGRPPKTRAKPGWYPIEKKVHAACLYAVTGNLEEVSKLTDIPKNHLKGLMVEQWWEDTVRQVRREENDQISAGMTVFIAKSLDAAIDRVEHGDYQLDLKTGVQHRVPVRLRDLAIPIGILVDKRNLLRGEATTRSEKLGQEDILKELGSKFESFAKKLGYKQVQIIDADVIEGEIVSAKTPEL